MCTISPQTLGCSTRPQRGCHVGRHGRARAAGPSPTAAGDDLAQVVCASWSGRWSTILMSGPPTPAYRDRRRQRAVRPGIT